RLPPTSTLFPYTTLFRSQPLNLPGGRVGADHDHRDVAGLGRFPQAPQHFVPRNIRELQVQQDQVWIVLAGQVERELSLHDREERSEEHTSELQSPCNLVC